ncbi:conserved Plasmodium protein, unknown function [Plasmodium chabaudi chabaudi]|uniref:Uncharacterized protein n=2 Tax=Plasmodium chabaudi TaxID=5825 RepID=A0A077TKE5_PLACU|nr:conserved Plasmodium protein, unknown function [Plasmodium chabaudi chabaudi]SCM22017.1 conserved Plasmodium protein, unknown function [Plasmodium chabaudi adami]SCM23297.1 conserved Plasmodium protein, unknown function [Plasmodium chabaudi chabaudi]SCN60813.1 conserved Plasmodium protein, unknown function [Plasmodium chabaudi adami]SCN60835.1 conserved Plasmodium protein, unknown function [Plasmodium chabaudi chabaudi]VTZ69032.1 conserved Plasmodium protein, unknown function [Plasmodium ch|eukprot:XP_016653914.1 conserved Plasmodium protein, unknown function [Plasmodium chabaudi chabaudi]
MDEKKKDFYTYVDNMHKKNEEIHGILDAKKKIKKDENKKIEESERMIKNNDVYIETIDDIHKNNKLSYLNLKKERFIQKSKLMNLNSMISELPIVMKGEEKKYYEFKQKSQQKINELLETLEPPLYPENIDDLWNKIKECQKYTEQLNNSITEMHNELNIVNKEYVNTKDKFRNLVELEKNKNKKLKKISATLQFIQNLKQGANKKENNEGDLKKKLDEINDLYK